MPEPPTPEERADAMIAEFVKAKGKTLEFHWDLFVKHIRQAEDDTLDDAAAVCDHLDKQAMRAGDCATAIRALMHPTEPA